MSTRIFVSYRTADGMDKATALARDLGRIFGAGAVFLDKEDLRGGSNWRDEIGRTLQGQPILLLLMTPQLIEARQDGGSLRIADPADPVRQELEAALAAGAHVIPVLCDGLSAPPDATKLPAPFHQIGALTWRKLRAYDWAHDIERLAEDLRALGVEAAPPASPAAAATSPSRPQDTAPATPTPPARTPAAAPQRRWLAGAAAAALALAALGGWWALRGPGTPGGDAGASTPESRLAGRWAATLWQGERAVLVLTAAPPGLTLASEPIAIDGRADWAEYRKGWRERTGRELAAVMYRGEGTARADPGQPAAIDIAIKVHPVPDSGEPIDSGNLSATLSADGRRLDGKIWLNGAQADQPATLVRNGSPGAAAGSTAPPRAAAPGASAATGPATAATPPPAPGAVLLPQVRLAGPAALSFSKIRKSTYTVLALTPERGDRSHWRLRATIRLTTAPQSGGMNFWDSSFRLLIDGVPRAPDSRLNEIVDSGASKEGDLTWDVPQGTQALVLRVHHYGEVGELPLALSSQGSQGAAALAAAAPEGPVTLAPGTPAEVEFVKPAPVAFTVLGVTSRVRRSGVLGVQVRVRMALPPGAVAANFWNDQFRLLVDGVPRAPDSDLNVVVEAGAARDGEIGFEVPAAARSLALRIQWSENAVADVPLKMEIRP